MELLERMRRHSQDIPDALAVKTSDGEFATYRAHWSASEAIAAFLRTADIAAHEPVVVYGHTSPLMTECFHACMKSGHPYVPLDCHTVPSDRVANIVGQIGSPTVLAVEDFPAVATRGLVIPRAELERIVADGVRAGAVSDESAWISGEDLCYILFTSDATGAPKGVQVTADCVDSFARWALTLGGIGKEGLTFLDKASFSFDLSIFGQVMSFQAGGTLYSLTKAAQDDFVKQFRAFMESKMDVWVSTPSFVDACLAEKTFDGALFKNLKLFLFSGETLTNATACRLLKRFPKAVIVNTYGPAESTVAVTSVTVTPEMAEADAPLAVGLPKPGTRIRVVDAHGTDVPAGWHGEIVVEGDTVAKGYFGREDLTAKAFGVADLEGRPVRTYRTGDEGWLDAEGMLHYRGRLDLQVKLDGFRIELGDIEENLRRLDAVETAAVVPAMRDGRVTHLVAHVVSAEARVESDFREGLKLKGALKTNLPPYMIPRKIVFHDALPMTPDGEVDRVALAAL